MKTFLIAMLLGIILGAAGLWFLQQRQAGTLTSTRERAVANAQQLLAAKLEALELQSDTITRELAETGRVVRRKASVIGREVADAATDARITATVKGKLAADPDLSALGISVSTTDGVVTLSGKVGSADLVGKATLLALETKGVREVISTLQIARG